ncbi:MAG: type III pantothenate kinase [Candidatus Sericytochromatia bacterium]|nr:type III pantothenate kinase [Candidatus Sericytochromatia bacterium]
MIAVNIGNTHVRWICYAGDRPLQSGRLTQAEALAGCPSLPPGRIALVSVVPQLAATWVAAWEAQGRDLFVLHGGLSLGLTIAYDPPQSLGADRLANAVALRHHFGAGIVIDAGTAATLTVVDAAGGLLGGAILPGLQTARDALASRTAQLPRVELAAPVRLIGASTEAAIQAGIVAGHVGALRHLVRGMQAEAPSARALVLTGGGAALLAPLMPEARWEPDWTLEGARLALLNAGS